MVCPRCKSYKWDDAVAKLNDLAIAANQKE